MEVKKGKVCFLCDGTGKYKKPIDETKYDKQFRSEEHTSELQSH